MEKTMRAVSVILSLFSILITLPYQTTGADLPCTRTVQGLPEEEKTEVVKQLGNLPAFFIENQGQVAEEARYYFKGSDTVYFTGEAVVFQKTGGRGQGLGGRGQGLETRETEPASLPPAGLDEPADHQTSPSLESLRIPPSLEGRGKGEGEHHPIHPEGQHVQSLSYKLEFVGANPTAPVAKSELEGKVNYLVGNDPSGWHTDIPTYQEIVYPGLYGDMESSDHVAGKSIDTVNVENPPSFGRGLHNRIDLVYKGVPGGMKYEFIVHPGANPDDIRLAYTGIEGLSIDDSGNLIIHTALGDVKDERPYTYQEVGGKKIEVTAEFRLISSPSPSLPPTPYPLTPSPSPTPYPLTPSSYGFEVGEYDPRYTLVIDPGLQYSTFLGGGDYDQGSGMALDSSGNAFVTGQTRSGNFPTTPGAYDRSHNGSSNVFVTKLNPTSGVVYSTFLGGGDYDVGYDIALDSSGNAFVTGRTSSGDFPTTPGAYDRSHNGGHDAFVTKLNPTGSALSYSTFLGGGDYDVGYDIALDSSGNAFVTGRTSSSDFPTTPGAYDRSHNGGHDAFVTKLNPTGSALSYSTFLGGGDADLGYGIALDSSGNAFVTGETWSGDFPTTPGAYDTSYNGGWEGDDGDVFVTKLNPTGSALSYSTFLGGGSVDWGYGIALDSSGNAFVTGYTNSGDFPTTPGAYDRSHNGVYDVFVTELNPTSGVVYSTFLGGGDYDWGDGIALDSSGNAFVTGYTRSGDFPTTPGAYDRSHNGDRDAFVTKLNPTSGVVYSTFLGGGGEDNAYDIALDSSGNAFVTGVTGSGNFPTTPGAYDRSYNDGYDAFVTRLDPFVSGEVVWGSYFNREGSLADAATSAATRGTSVFVAGYTTDAVGGGGNTFSVRAYNATTGALLWQNHYDRAGNLNDRANAVAVNGTGDKVFAVGYTTTTYPLLLHPLLPQRALPSGGTKVFAGGPTTADGSAFSVRAYNTTTGALLWENHYDREGSLSDVANAVAVAGDKVFVAGYTTTAAGGNSLTVRAYNATTGAFLWQCHCNREGSLSDVANAVAVNGAGDKVFVAGYTTTAAGGNAFAIRVYNATTGALLWENHYNREGSLVDRANAVSVSGNRVFVAGYTTTLAGGNAFTIRTYNATTGALLWENHYNREGSLVDRANAVSVSGNRVFVTGYTTTTAGGNAFAVRAYNVTTGALLWENHYNREGALGDVAKAVVVNGDGDKVFVAGYTSTTAGGLASSVMAHNATSGALLWQNHLDREGNLADVANSVAVMDNSDVFVVGYTTTTAGGQVFAVRELRQ